MNKPCAPSDVGADLNGIYFQSNRNSHRYHYCTTKQDFFYDNMHHSRKNSKSCPKLGPNGQISITHVAANSTRPRFYSSNNFFRRKRIRKFDRSCLINGQIKISCRLTCYFQIYDLTITKKNVDQHFDY